MMSYRKDFDEIKYISFFIKIDKLIEKYGETWDKVKNIILKEIDSEPA